jgi:hypothetical protein
MDPLWGCAARQRRLACWFLPLWAQPRPELAGYERCSAMPNLVLHRFPDGLPEAKTAERHPCDVVNH